MKDRFDVYDVGLNESIQDESERYELIAQVAQNYDDLAYGFDNEEKLAWDSDDTVVDIRNYMLTG